jgi:hypothetical protein
VAQSCASKKPNHVMRSPWCSLCRRSSMAAMRPVTPPLDRAIHMVISA